MCDTNVRVENVSYGAPLGSAKQAHLTISLKLVAAKTVKKKNSKQISSLKFDLNRSDFTKIQNEIEHTNWDETFANKSPNLCYESLLEFYHKIFKLHILEKKIQNGTITCSPWATNNNKELS